MTDLNVTAVEHITAVTPMALNNDTNTKNSELINVQRRATEMSAEWVPVSFNEIPITSNTLNITLNNNDIRPNITSIPSNTRTIAPKPVMTTTTTANASGDGTQALIITTSSDSIINPSTAAKPFSRVPSKVIPISSQLALVTSPDGHSMVAVPLTSFIKQNVNIKPSGVPVSISPANVKSKTPIITPLKVLPLIASTTTSTSVTFPAMTHSKNVSTVITSAPMAIATTKCMTTPVSTATAGGVTIIPTSVSSLSSMTSTETTPELTATTTATITALPLESKPSITSNDDSTKVSEDKLQSTLPPLTQNTSLSTIPITNSQTLTPPALTPVSINTTTNSNSATTLDIQNKNKITSKTASESETSSLTGIEEMDSVLQIMEWKDGIGVLPGSDLKFRIDEFGNLDMIDEQDVEEVSKKKIKVEESSSENQISQQNDTNNEISDTNDSESVKVCINCGLKGLAQNFIRQGRFCSKSCATIQATHLKLFTKRNTDLSLVKAQEQEKKKNQSKKAETIKVRKSAAEQIEQSSNSCQTESNDQPIDVEMENNEEANEEVEDVETNTGNYNENVSNGLSQSSPSFSWRQYLSQTNSIAAPIKSFNENQSFPSLKNNFKVGMKLEGIDPQHPSKFCVLSVIEVCGFRLRLHFDGYKELFDFWVNADHNFLFPAGFCERTQRKLEPPLGITREEFNWNNYLQQTRAVAAPKHLFTASNGQQSVPSHGFRVSMKLEAVDRANTALVCVATIADIIDNWLLIHFDGWDDSYDYWAETTSPFIHAINWCRTKGRSLTPPKDYYKSSERFSWEEYLSETKSMAVSPRSFKTRVSNNFKVNMKLEVVDKRNPKLIRVSSISHRQSHSIKIHFEGWDEKYDYWVDDDCPDIHPVNWCHKTGHPLQPPPDPSIKKDETNSCPTPSCNGIGHIRGPKYLSHYSTVSCPYTDARLEYELPDRLGNPSNRNNLENMVEESDETQARVSPSHSPTPSESNSLSSVQKSQKALKSQHIIASNKSRKRKGLVIGNSSSNGPISPSSNSESAKHSRPSTPSSVTNLSTLQQSIFAMRMSQQQQEAPICWDRHSKTSLPGIDQTKSKDVLLWTPSKVAEFIDLIPGCQTVGQVFQDELIDGEAFLLLNQNDIVKILGLKLGPAIKIYNSILVIRDNSINEDIV